MNLLLLVFDFLDIHYLLHFIVNVLELQFESQFELLLGVNVGSIFQFRTVFRILFALVRLV